ncbi:MAG: endonuclease/exonuclease/phosphatase family protein [Krumholzibacteria bacterium]|nr:endonuclease/exonuclease/phosphatase family protein [Candidatus Krumholzibacteria bacterium]
MRTSRHLALLPLLAAACWGLASCGGSDTSTPPPAADNPFAEAAVGTDSTLEVMTWNLETFPISFDQDDPQPVAELATVRLVTQAIAGLDVDIVAVQEIFQGNGHPGRSAFDAVAAGLQEWAGFRSTADGYMDLGFFYRVGGDLGDPTFTDILTEESYVFPRPPLVMQATWRGRPIVVVNNHFKCCDDGVERRRQACLLLEQYVEATFPDTPVIIVGDLNDELDDSLAENVFANFLADTASWRFVDLGFTRSAGGPVSYPSWGSHLDHILITDELFVAAEKAEALVQVLLLEAYLPGGLGAYYRDLSDHRPVVLRITP